MFILSISFAVTCGSSANWVVIICNSGNSSHRLVERLMMSVNNFDVVLYRLFLISVSTMPYVCADYIGFD